MFCVIVNCSSSAVMTTSVVARGVDAVDTCDSNAAVTHTVDTAAADSYAVCSTASSDLHTGTTVDNAVPSLASSSSLPTGHAEHVSAVSDISQGEVADTQSVSEGPQISPAGDGFVTLTLSYSPLTMESVADDHLSVRNAAAEFTDRRLISTTADSGGVLLSSADGVIGNSLSQRFVDCICLCCTSLCFCFLNNKLCLIYIRELEDGIWTDRQPDLFIYYLLSSV